jgi:FdhD protein
MANNFNFATSVATPLRRVELQTVRADSSGNGMEMIEIEQGQWLAVPSELEAGEVIVEKSFVVQVDHDGINTGAQVVVNSGQLKSIQLLCTPVDLEALVVGALFAHGIIASGRDVVSMKCDGDVIAVQLQQPVSASEPRSGYVKSRRNINPYSPCSPCSNKSVAVANFAPKIIALMEELQQRQSLFKRTGAAHAALLVVPVPATVRDVEDSRHNQEAYYFAEDIGRHNAIDKVIGKCLMAHDGRGEAVPAGSILILSSRVSFELMNKVVRAGIELVAAVSAPSSLAVELARQHHVTLCAFVRGKKFNIYS